MKKDLKSTQSGGLSAGTTGIPQDLQSTNAGSPSMSDTSATIPKAKSQKDSLPTNNFLDVPNAVRLIQALAAKLKGFVFWKSLVLRDGQSVYALCFPVRKWDVDPVSKELKLR